MTLSDHRGPVSSIQFHNTSASLLYSGGWDHSLRTWDLTTETNLNTKNCEKPFNSIHINSSNSLLASGHTDRLIRLWDARVNDNAVMKLGLVGHSNWVSQVFWNEQNDSQLISSSYDGTIRGWDIRSKTPIFTLNHNAENPESKVLCVNWFDNLIVSGGDDQILGIHKVNDQN
jgi:ribosome biogenesis protein YTM1